MTRTKPFIIALALLSILCELFLIPPVLATEPPGTGPGSENLTVDSVWLNGDMLNIEVTENQSGYSQTLAVPLSDYAGNNEYVSIQAADRDGNISNTVQFKNPLYTPLSALDGDDTAPHGGPDMAEPKPFTPGGNGTVVDNATDGDGKEFFSIKTEDGNIFYLIVDRQRDSDNVYLLNVVTEADLAALAEKNGGTAPSAIPVKPSAPSTPADAPDVPASEQPVQPSKGGGGMGGGSVIFIIVGAAALGGAVYYIKIIRPRKQSAHDDDDDDNYEYDGDDVDADDGCDVNNERGDDE